MAVVTSSLVNYGIVLVCLCRLYTVICLSPANVQFIENGQWNSYCNSSMFASMSGTNTSIILTASHPSQAHTLYGSCLLSFGNLDKGGFLHLTFIKYPAFHECSNGDLVFYEKVNGIVSILWNGSCGDATHRWSPRSFISTSSDIWVFYNKQTEWPEYLSYSEIDFALFITNKAVPGDCYNTLCSSHGECKVRGPAPPRSLTSFSVDREIWECHCKQPYVGPQCSDVNFPENNCTYAPCLNDGRCVLEPERPTGFYCDCKPPYSGEHCEFNSAVCLGNDICGDNGRCVVVRGVVTCQCDTFWIGSRCDILSPCHSMPCMNGGVCVTASFTEFSCICKGMWSGVVCSQLITFATVGTTTSSANASTTELKLNEQADASDESNETSKEGAMIILFVLCGLATLLMLMLALACVVKLQKSSKERNKRDKTAKSSDKQETAVQPKQHKPIIAERLVAPPAEDFNYSGNKKPVMSHWNDLKQIVNTSKLSHHRLAMTTPNPVVIPTAKGKIGNRRKSRTSMVTDTQAILETMYQPNQMPAEDNSFTLLDTFNIRKGIRRSEYLTRKPVSRNRDNITAYRREMAARFSVAQRSRAKPLPVLNIFKSISSNVMNKKAALKEAHDTLSALKTGISEPSLVKKVPSFPLLGKSEGKGNEEITSESLKKIEEREKFRTSVKAMVSKLESGRNKSQRDLDAVVSTYSALADVKEGKAEPESVKVSAENKDSSVMQSTHLAVRPKQPLHTVKPNDEKSAVKSKSQDLSKSVPNNQFEHHNLPKNMPATKSAGIVMEKSNQSLFSKGRSNAKNSKTMAPSVTVTEH